MPAPAAVQGGPHLLHSTALCLASWGADGRIPLKSLASSRDDEREHLLEAYRSESPQSWPVAPEGLPPGPAMS